MQKVIEIYPCLLKLSRKQDTILNISDFSNKNQDFPPKPLLQIFPCKNLSKIMIITCHMQTIIQIYPCLLKLLRKQDTILNIGDFSTKNYDFLPKHLFQIFPCQNPSKIMIITSDMQKIIQIYPCLLKLSHKQDTILNIGDFSTKN